jgi:hypothetical protein
MKNINSYKIWCDEGLNPPYVLIVKNDLDNLNKIDIIDPKDNNKIIFSSNDYSEIKEFLLEDEFTIVKDRMIIEESLY